MLLTLELVMEEECALFQAYLEGRNMRFTSVRRAILEIVSVYEGDFTVRDILPRVRVRGGAIDRASLYRNFQLLLSSGIIETVPPDERVVRGSYRLIRRTRRKYLLCCPGCHSAEEIADESLDAALRRLCSRFHLNFETLQVRIEARHLPGRHLSGECR